MSQREFQFEWDEAKARINLTKHDVTFELARTVFDDPRILTLADVEHSDEEERWLSIGLAGNHWVLVVVHLWKDAGRDSTKIRIISARKATQAEIRYYQEGI